MASKAKQIYWAVRRVLTERPGEMVARWESQTGDRELPDHHFETVVYYADGPVNLYQLRQWYEPLRQWNEHSPTVLLCRSVSAALALLEESPVPVLYGPRLDDIERLVNHQDFRMALYVNQNTRNFQMMRFNSMLHVFISHGESDKTYMISGQLKAYDYAFIAGDAAADRLSRALLGYDVPARTKRIGRPQLDAEVGGGPTLADDDRTVVFYAPTWEGDRSSMTYGSLVSHGLAMLPALLRSGRHRVIVRPHPRTGVVAEEHRQAVDQVRALLARANAQDPGAHHLFDETPSFDWQLRRADACITDVSAAAIDWLATGKPLVVTEPVDHDAALPDEGFLATADLLPASRARDIVAVLDQVISDEAAAEDRMRWTRHYFGDITPGVATGMWLKACREVVDTCIALREALHQSTPESSDITTAHRPMSAMEEAELDS